MDSSGLLGELNQKERHNKMLEKGFKKRSFYVNEDTIKALTSYREANKLESLDEALQQILKNLNNL